MRFKFFLLLLMSIFIRAEALLPPAWQSVAEIEALLKDERLKDYLESGDIINSIQRFKEGWVIHTNRSKIIVTVTSQPQSTPGPEKFTLTFKKAYGLQ